jgi:hypothetical protein
MLTELETRLAQVLGSRLDAPFAGRVVRRSAPAPGGNGPVIRVGVLEATPVDDDLLSIRPEVVPGDDQLRRVLRLQVELGLFVSPTQAGGEAQLLQGVDALGYTLDDPEVRSAAALEAPGDPGFRLDSLLLEELATSTADAAQPQVRLRGTGLFWPVGVVGETGPAIERALVREVRLPMTLRAQGPLEPGGGAVALQLSVGTTGTLRSTDTATDSLPFGSLAVRLTDAAGGTGAGSLSGGLAGPDGNRLVTVDEAGASVDYTPAAAPGTDIVVVSGHTRDSGGNDRIGMELARFEMAVR